jgi:hypothetical protein
MPIAPFEMEVLRLLAANRSPESHVGGATVLHQVPESRRTSEDIDVFHDTVEALERAEAADTATLENAGYEVERVAQQPLIRRARVGKGGERTKLEWVFDSAFRFYPAQVDSLMGYRLHFWDAATNKILAGCGRGKIRDYFDMIELHQRHLSLGALIWAAAGKDDGLSPSYIIEELARVQRYPRKDYEELRLTEPVDPKAMKMQWLEALAQARCLVNDTLLDAPYGCFFLDETGCPVTPTPETLPQLRPHHGSVRGAWPRIVEE